MLRVRKKLPSNRGIAMLEFAGCMAVLLPLILAAWAVVDLMWSWNQLNRAIDSELSGYDGFIRPFHSEISASGNFRLKRDDDAFNSELDRMATKIETAIIDQAGGGTVNQGHYKVMVNLVVADVSTTSGAISSLFEHSHVGEAGNMAASSEAPSSVGLAEELNHDNPINSLGGSTFAIPSGLYGRDTSDRYLPATYFLTVRVFQDVEGTLGGMGLKLLGRATEIFSGKAMTLRGGVDL